MSLIWCGWVGCQLPGRHWRGTWAVLKGDERKDTFFICDVVSSAICVWQKTSCKVNPCSFQWPEGQPVISHLCLLVRINLYHLTWETCENRGSAVNNYTMIMLPNLDCLRHTTLLSWAPLQWMIVRLELEGLRFTSLSVIMNLTGMDEIWEHATIITIFDLINYKMYFHNNYFNTAL